MFFHYYMHILMFVIMILYHFDYINDRIMFFLSIESILLSLKCF